MYYFPFFIQVKVSILQCRNTLLQWQLSVQWHWATSCHIDLRVIINRFFPIKRLLLFFCNQLSLCLSSPNAGQWIPLYICVRLEAFLGELLGVFSWVKSLSRHTAPQWETTNWTVTHHRPYEVIRSSESVGSQPFQTVTPPKIIISELGTPSSICLTPFQRYRRDISKTSQILPLAKQ